tara:strand:+ start:820 stop:1332 length:513 start_codon:yes stop_codon:yes gene_type:complete
MKTPKNEKDLNNKESKKEDFNQGDFIEDEIVPEELVHPECVGEELNISPEVPNNLKELLERQETNIFNNKLNTDISDTTKEVLKLLAENQAGPKEDIELASLITKRLLGFYSGVIDKLITYEECEKEVLISLTKDTDRLALAVHILSNIKINTSVETVDEEIEDEYEEEE